MFDTGKRLYKIEHDLEQIYLILEDLIDRVYNPRKYERGEAPREG